MREGESAGGGKGWTGDLLVSDWQDIENCESPMVTSTDSGDQKWEPSQTQDRVVSFVLTDHQRSQAHGFLGLSVAGQGFLGLMILRVTSGTITNRIPPWKILFTVITSHL